MAFSEYSGPRGWFAYLETLIRPRPKVSGVKGAGGGSAGVASATERSADAGHLIFPVTNFLR